MKVHGKNILISQNEPGQYNCVSGKVNRADKLHLVMESIQPDAKHGVVSTAPVHLDGAGGSSMR
jgi:hypothetical protein